VKSYLVSKGLEESRLLTLGFGASYPLVLGNTEAHWAVNRRVEFLLTRAAVSASHGEALWHRACVHAMDIAQAAQPMEEQASFGTMKEKLVEFCVDDVRKTGSDADEVAQCLLDREVFVLDMTSRCADRVRDDRNGQR